MVISLRGISRTCRGIQGSFSVVRNLLGYSEDKVPGITSLIQELVLLRDNEHVTIHLKIVSTPTWTFTSAVSVDQMIFSMREVFGNAGLSVIVKSTENLTLNDSDIDVGECIRGTVTNEQTTLFSNRNFVGPSEIVVYLVNAVLDAMGMMNNGCATFPLGSPGAVVSGPIASTWTLAHEVGHILGINHIETDSGTCPSTLMPPQLNLCDLANIMTCCGTSLIPMNTVPVFNSDQIDLLISSNLSANCIP